MRVHKNRVYALIYVRENRALIRMACKFLPSQVFSCKLARSRELCFQLWVCGVFRLRVVFPLRLMFDMDW
jgi:hypothetical protein